MKSPKPDFTDQDKTEFLPVIDANDQELEPEAIDDETNMILQDLDHNPENTLEHRDIQALLLLIERQLEEDKAQDIVIINLTGKSSLADYIVIASGRSQRHVSAISDHLARSLKNAGYGKVRTEGLPQADWVLMDIGDVIVHIFRPEVRVFYRLEQIWSLETPGSAHRGEAV